MQRSIKGVEMRSVRMHEHMERWWQRVWLGLFVATCVVSYGIGQGIGPNPTVGVATDLTVTNDSTTNATMYPMWVTAAGDVPAYISTTAGKLSFNPSTSTLTATTFAGNASTATTATNATNGTTVAIATNASFFPLFAASVTNGNQPFNLDAAGFTYNPSTNNLTATTFTGALAGNATTSTTATNATNGATVAVSNSASYFPLFAAASASGNQPFNLGTGLTFNPSTNALTTTTFVGALTGNASTATSATTAANGVTWSAVSGSTTIATSQGYMVDTSGGVVTITLAASPTVGDHVSFVDASGTFATNNLTIARNTKPIMGSANDLVVSTNNASLGLVYQGVTNGWRIVGY